jgi:hypothetical protein
VLFLDMIEILPPFELFFSKNSNFDFQNLDLGLWISKLDKTWTQGSSQHKEQVYQCGFSQIQIFSFQIRMNMKKLGFGETGRNLRESWG